MFGIKSLQALLNFSKEARKYVEEVTFSIVDVINEEQIKKAKELAESMNITLKIRQKD